MHQKRFTDERDRLYFYDTRYPEEGVRRTTAGSLFCEGHLYSEIANDGTKDPSLERFFSSLETRIAPIIDKVIGAARRNQPPRLTRGEKATWDRFFVLQYK